MSFIDFNSLGDPNKCDVASFVQRMKELLILGQCNWDEIKVAPLGSTPPLFPSLWAANGCSVPDGAIVIVQNNPPDLWYWDGIQWELITAPNNINNEFRTAPAATPVVAFNGLFVSNTPEQDAVVIRGNNEIWFTSNGGASWNPFLFPTTNALTANFDNPFAGGFVTPGPIPRQTMQTYSVPTTAVGQLIMFTARWGLELTGRAGPPPNILYTWRAELFCNVSGPVTGTFDFNYPRPPSTSLEHYYVTHTSYHTATALGNAQFQLDFDFNGTFGTGTWTGNRRVLMVSWARL